MATINITTERVQLRPIVITDLDAIHELHSLPETDEYNTLGIPDNIETTRSIIEPWIADNKRIELEITHWLLSLSLGRSSLGYLV